MAQNAAGRLEGAARASLRAACHHGVMSESEADERRHQPSSDPADGPIDADAPEEVYELLRRAEVLMRGRHHAQAAVVLERANRRAPGKGSIIELLGRAYYNSGQHARAAETFGVLLEVDPSAPYGHYGLGQSLKQLGRRREARTHLRLAVALSPGSRLYRDALERLGPTPDPGG